MTRRRLGTRRSLFFRRRRASVSPTWPSGADGALVINGTTTKILAGSVKDYSSISIINNGILEICDGPTFNGSSIAVNDGSSPTYIGCSGNCTINTGGMIRATHNNQSSLALSGATYSSSAPSGAAIVTFSYNSGYGQGGTGGDSFLNPGGTDFNLYGHGGGGGGGFPASDTNQIAEGWAQSGTGGESSEGGGGGSPVGPFYNGSGTAGIRGADGFGDGSGLLVGAAGGSGGVRAYSGGGTYLQVAGTISVSGVVLVANGSDGAVGGDGGDCFCFGFDSAAGAGAGGGGGGGYGGKWIVRYKLGTISSANCNVLAGGGGQGGAPGSGFTDGGDSYNGTSGNSGSDGIDGSVSIATY
jgi:hypothetical protein